MGQRELAAQELSTAVGQSELAAQAGVRGEALLPQEPQKQPHWIVV